MAGSISKLARVHPQTRMHQDAQEMIASNGWGDSGKQYQGNTCTMTGRLTGVFAEA